MDESDDPGFEASLERLERTVRSLESGDLGLDDSLAAYERGVRLLAHCQGLLDVAEKRVALLTGVGDDGTPESVPFDGTVGDISAPEPPARKGRRRRSEPTDDGIPY